MFLTKFTINQCQATVTLNNHHKMGTDVTKPVFQVSYKRDSNQSSQLQKQARKLKNSLVATTCKFRYDTFVSVNSKGTNQSKQMLRLVSTFVVHKPSGDKNIQIVRLSCRTSDFTIFTCPADTCKSFEIVCSKEHKEVICNMTSSSNSF